jgi:hypothetical protein
MYPTCQQLLGALHTCTLAHCILLIACCARCECNYQHREVAQLWHSNRCNDDVFTECDVLSMTCLVSRHIPVLQGLYCSQLVLVAYLPVLCGTPVRDDDIQHIYKCISTTDWLAKNICIAHAVAQLSQYNRTVPHRSTFSCHSRKSNLTYCEIVCRRIASHWQYVTAYIVIYTTRTVGYI